MRTSLLRATSFAMGPYDLHISYINIKNKSLRGCETSSMGANAQTISTHFICIGVTESIYTEGICVRGTLQARLQQASM